MKGVTQWPYRIDMIWRELHDVGASRGLDSRTGRLDPMFNDAEEVEASSEPTQLEEAPPIDNTPVLLARIGELEHENLELKDQKLRAMAESQNTLRRFRAEAENQRKFAHEGIVRDLIPVLDNFDRTLAAIEKAATIEALTEGVKAIEKQLKKVIESHGVQRIDPQGEMFDPVMHEAVVTHASEEHPEDTILDVIEAGYVLHDRVIRPSRVRVSKKP